MIMNLWVVIINDTESDGDISDILPIPTCYQKDTAKIKPFLLAWQPTLE